MVEGWMARIDCVAKAAVMTAPATIQLARDAENPWYEVILVEGRNRQIRRMFKQIGHDVEKIKRVRYGPLELDVPPGKYRRLTTAEVAGLTRAAGVRGARPYRSKSGNDRRAPAATAPDGGRARPRRPATSLPAASADARRHTGRRRNPAKRA